MTVFTPQGTAPVNPIQVLERTVEELETKLKALETKSIFEKTFAQIGNNEAFKVPASKNTKIALRDIIVDLGGNCKEGEYTVPATGYYLVTGVIFPVGVAAAGATQIAGIYVGGASIAQGFRSTIEANEELQMPVNSIVKLNSGEKVTLGVFLTVEREIPNNPGVTNMCIIRIA